MASLYHVVLFALAGGVFSLIGGFLLLARKSSAQRLAGYATPFAAGALLSAAFLDLLVEAVEHGTADRALMAALGGILLFFLLERFFHWFHHHHEHDGKHKDPVVPLIIVGDTLHNMIDGIVIAAGFLVDVQTGVVVTLAVAAHEIPQEIGDFGLLLHKGVSKRKVILINILSALATVFMAVLFFELGQSSDGDLIPLDITLGLIAGMFIYIAASDIIPSIHKREDSALAGIQTTMLIIGVITVGLATTWLHGYIEPDSDHSQKSSFNEQQTG